MVTVVVVRAGGVGAVVVVVVLVVVVMVVVVVFYRSEIPRALNWPASFRCTASSLLACTVVAAEIRQL